MLVAVTVNTSLFVRPYVFLPTRQCNNSQFCALVRERDFGDVQRLVTSFTRSEPMPFLPMEYVNG